MHRGMRLSSRGRAVIRLAACGGALGLGGLAAAVAVSGANAALPSLPTVTLTTPVTSVTVTAPTLTTPTVTTPTVALPPPPVPVPPPPPVAAPPPPPAAAVPPPPSLTPTSASSPATPVGGSASAPAGGAGSGGSTPAAGSGTSSPLGAATPGSGSGAGSRAGAATRSRGTSTRRGVSRPARFVLALPQRAPIRLVYRGPAPSCAIAGTSNVRGRAGRNVLRVTGRIRDGRLRPGLFRVDAFVGDRRVGRLAVGVTYPTKSRRPKVTRRESVALRCDLAAAAIVGELVTGGPATSGRETVGTKVPATDAGTTDETIPPTIGDVAGDQHTLPIPLPDLGDDPGALGWLAAAAILAVLLLAPLGIATYVWRFLRGDPGATA